MGPLIRKHPTIFVALIFLAGQFGSLTGYSLEEAINDQGHVQEEIQNGETFDFIVAGGGTAGCAVATRLAASGEYTVLLIEAGGFPHPDLAIPALSPAQVGNPNVSRIYPSIRQLNAALDQNGIVSFARGNMLGGSSGLNGQILNRGSPHDYNNWAKLTGDDSWNYANMLKYFRKYENYSGDYPSNQRGFHGPITVSRQRYAPGADEWLQAGRELGFDIAEPNGPQIISFAPSDFTRKEGRRVTSYNGYVEPMLQRESISTHSDKRHSFQSRRKSNLLILINTEVDKIMFEGNRAVGVKFRSASSKYLGGYAKARKEVIVSTGAMDTPVFLMKSGIGPKSVLDGAGIHRVKILPVGKNLHDHPAAAIVVAFGNRSAAFDEDNDLTPEAWRLFQEFGDGPYTSSVGEATQAFLASSILPPEERYMGWSDLQLVPLFSNVRTGLWDRDQVDSELREGEIAMPWGVWVGRPKSRGTVTLNPRNVDGIPLIDFQFLTNPYDIRVMVDGLKALVKICEGTAAFQKVGCRVIDERLPACSHHKYRSDPFWDCYGRQRTRFGYHAVGTCRMGRGSNDHEAVVDPKLRVIGIDGLRVVDASIMPAITNANTQAPVYAIAEKAADMILQRWKSNYQLH